MFKNEVLNVFFMIPVEHAVKALPFPLSLGKYLSR